ISSIQYTNTPYYDTLSLHDALPIFDDMKEFKADIAVLLNITPDHLDRYDHNMDHYIDSKFRIIQNQKEEDIFIYCEDDAGIRRGLTRHMTPAKTYRFSQDITGIEGAYLNKYNEMTIVVNDKTPFTMSINELALQGKHNVYNNMASGIVAKVLELKNESIRESMGEYQNIPHRLEHVACISGINFINDSKATNVNAVWYALESFPANIILILGGVDKGNDYQMLKDLVRSKASAIVCLGKDNKRIHEAFE